MTDITRNHLERDLSREAAPRVTTLVDRDLELQLVARLRERDPAAFEAVHDAFNARLFNFLARPAATVPCATTAGGLSIGFMIATRPQGEELALRLAAVVSTA